MDNEREIKDLENTRDFFLRKDLAELHKKREYYDLEKEFSETRKNKKLWVVWLVLGIVAVLTLTAYLITKGVQKKSKTYELELDEFQDVNLGELLDEVKKIEEEMRIAEQDLAALVAEKNNKIRDVNNAADNELKLLDTKKLGKAEKNRRIDAVEQERAAQLQAIDSKYDPIIEEQRQKYALIEERKQRYDSRQVESARNQETLLNNQKQLYEIEKKSLIEEYEKDLASQKEEYEARLAEMKSFLDEYDTNIKLLYDPVFTGEKNVKLMNAPIDEDRRRTNLPPFNPLYYPESIVTHKELEDLDAQLRDIRYLIDLVYSIPFDNSVETVLRQIDYRILKFLDSFKKISDKVAAQTELGNSYGYAFESVVRETGGQGIILDPRDPRAIVIYLDPVITVPEGTEAYLFRLDEQLVGRIMIYRNGDGLERARLLEVTRGFEPRPFDKIILHIEDEQQ